MDPETVRDARERMAREMAVIAIKRFILIFQRMGLTLSPSRMGELEQVVYGECFQLLDRYDIDCNRK